MVQEPVNYADSLTYEFDTGDHVNELGDIHVWIKNKSNNWYVFPYDYGVKMQFLENGVWEELPSIPINYFPHDDIIMEKFSKAVFNSYPVSFSPAYLS